MARWEVRSCGHITMPPSTGSTCPVMYDAAFDAMKTNAPATSDGSAQRFIGMRFIMLVANFSLVRIVSVIGVAASGASALTMMLLVANSRASDLVKPMMPALATE